ncbi:NEDD4-binding protein 1 isoform X1 [Alosa alosa]|nr:NEDD4-binding protein 1 isoform X1 [Alosa alosa]
MQTGAFSPFLPLSSGSSARRVPAMAFASEESSEGMQLSENEPMVEDEFTCSAALRGAVLALQPTAKRVFGVELDIALDEEAEVHQTGLMWLLLKGKSGDVLAAKLFVKGAVNQEEQQEVPYPEVLHSVFCGARGLFMDCLIRNTSAHIVVGSPGCVLISGLAEPVVRAYSLIVDLVERYESSQGRRMDAGARGAVESLDSRRAFKTLVERWDDRHTLDLLVLPVSVKEVLLELVRDSPWNTASATLETAVARTDTDEHEAGRGATAMVDRASHSIPDEQPDSSRHSSGSSVLPTRSDSTGDVEGQHSYQRQGTVVPSVTPGRELSDPFFRSFAVVDGAPRGQVEGADERGGGPRGQQGWRGGAPQEVVDEAFRTDMEAVAVGSQDDLGLRLKFFTAMGFKEDVVKRVLARTGPVDPCDILEQVQQEQDRDDGGGGEEEEKEKDGISRRSGDGAEGEAAFSSSSRTVERGAANHSSQGSFGDRSLGEGLRSGGGGEEEEEDDDFVLGVVKRAAASCGYTEERVLEVCSNLPELSFHQLLLELQRQGERDGKPVRTNPAEATAATHRAQQRAKESPTDLARKEVGEMRRRKEEEERGAGRAMKNKASLDKRDKEKGGDNQGELLGREPSAKAVSTLGENVLVEHRAIERFLIDQAYQDSPQEAPVKRESPALTDRHDIAHTRPPVTGAASSSTRTNNWNTFNPQNHQNHHRGPVHTDSMGRGGSSSIRGPPRPSYPHDMLVEPQKNPHSATLPAHFGRPPQRQGLPPMGARAVVTGQQRFLEGLQMPFELKLAGGNGDPGLRQVIIDGSNVAMSHGLGQFFSCRGIALAVQHFWDRGHRQISALVPQWRQKRDPKVKEQPYLTELLDLGLLSFTPSREVMGKRINSYDDRFMLQLAQKTNGVIVTNDNMRDLFDESHAWKDIIRKSLLQYTFVGDHFMVPDDPLGRDGPHLNDFLRSQQRSSVTSSHTFPGMASSVPNPLLQQQRSQTEVPHFHDRTPGGGRVAPEFQPDHPDLQPQGPVAGQPPHPWEQAHRRGGRRGGGGGGGGLGRAGPETQPHRSAKETSRLRESLSQVFPGQESAVTLALQKHPILTDVNLLSHYILEHQAAGE